MHFQDWIQLGIMVVTSLGVTITVFALIITLRNFKKQLQLSFFSEYTKRYQEIILNLPLNINEDSFSYDDLDAATKDRTLRYMRAYFDLCSEEYDLWKNGSIEKGVWEKWSSGMRFSFSKKAFQEAWKKIELNTGYYKDFGEFVNNKIREAGWS